MISSNRRPNLGFRKDQAAKRLLPQTSCSLPPFREASKPTFNAMIHSKPRPNKTSLHQRDRCQSKYMRTDSLERDTRRPRQPRWRTGKSLLRFATLETPKRGLNSSSMKHKPSMKIAARSWPRKERKSTGFSKKNDPMRT